MRSYDADLYAPMDDAGAEQERVCATCRYYEPCPCGCVWGICRDCQEHVSATLPGCEGWEEA